MLGWGHGHGVIVDSSYRIVDSVEAGGIQAAADMHEFNLLPDGKTAYLTIYKKHQWDLSKYGIADGLGWIQEGRFQEVDVKTGEVVFEWRSLDHVDTDESYVLPGTTEISGNGFDKESPWDYIHINSIDKSEAGDYLISARHTSCIYKISGKTGEVMWRLHGSKSSFQMLDGFSFSHQHDARFIVDNEKETIISLFDNASNGLAYNVTKDHSAGMIAQIDHVEKTARLLKEYVSPDNRLSTSQGNFQILDSRTGIHDNYYGNVVLGWGNWAFWSEAVADTTETVWYGSIAAMGTMNYRAFKANWTGHPITKPALWTYSKTGRPGDWKKGSEEKEGGTSWFVSWNGATEVKTWKLYGSTESLDGPWADIAEIPKRGFETIYRHPSLSTFAYIEGFDEAGKLLGRSPSIKTFVPGEKLREFGNCDDFGCGQGTGDGLEEIKRKKEEEEQKLRDEEEKFRLEKERKSKRLSAAYGVIGGVIGIFLLAVAFKKGLHHIVIGVALGLWDLLTGMVGKGRRRGEGIPFGFGGRGKGKYSAIPNGRHDDGLLGRIGGAKSSMDGRHGNEPRSPQVW